MQRQWRITTTGSRFQGLYNGHSASLVHRKSATLHLSTNTKWKLLCPVVLPL
jgi:hypothetical protein